MRRTKSKRIGMAGKLLGAGLIIFLLLGSLGWVYRSTLLTGTLEVKLARLGSIEHNQTITAVFANEEVPIVAPTAGKPEFLGKAGQRFRKGDPVAVIVPEGAVPGQNGPKNMARVAAPVGGILFYETDGLESILTLENLLVMDIGKALEKNGASPKVDGSVQSGGRFGKIVNNLRPTVAVIEMASTEEHKVGKTLRFRINNQTYSAKIIRLLENPLGMVVQFNQYIEGSAERRMQEIDWTSKPIVNGVIVPKSSLWNKGEEQGVYVAVEGILQFRKVKVVDENEHEVCVEGLPHGIPVIINPHEGLDGLTMNVKIPSQT
jgi:putative membrane fusion protein